MERGRGGGKRWQHPGHRAQQHQGPHQPSHQQQQYWYGQAAGPSYYIPCQPTYYDGYTMVCHPASPYPSWPAGASTSTEHHDPSTQCSAPGHPHQGVVYYYCPGAPQPGQCGYVAWPMNVAYGYVPMMVPYSVAGGPAPPPPPPPRPWLADESADARADHASESDEDDRCSEAGSVDSDTVSPNYPIENVEASSWSSLTVGILQNIITTLSEGDVKCVRLVCRHWRAVLDHNLEQLTPSSMKSKCIVTRFPNLKVLHLTQCANIRNRDLLIIARSGLRLHTLTLGDDTNKPWVTNKGLASIAQVTTLTSLNLQDCNSVTNKGLKSLNNLKNLTQLSLKGCRKLTNSGLEALSQNTALTALNLFGCLRISDKGLLPLGQLNLHSLSLGQTRVKDEGLAYIGLITSLRELHFMSEEMTSQGLKQLSTLTNLQSLALRDLAQVSGDALSQLIPKLSHLEHLDLYKNKDFNDAQLGMCLDFLSNVAVLDLRGTKVSQEGLSELVRLNNLQKLCLGLCTPSPAPANGQDGAAAEQQRDFFSVIGSLTQLTSLTLNNCTIISTDLMDSLRHLHQLRELDLSDDADKDVSPHVPPVENPAIDAMATITSLTCLDLSRRPVQDSHLSVLAQGLTRLRTLIVVGCPVQDVSALQRRFPELIIHKKPLQDLSCNASDYGGSS